MLIFDETLECTMDDTRIPRTALLLGLGGLVPFVLCALAIFTGVRVPLLSDPVLAMLAYGAIILSFLGGVRWGFALRISDEGLQSRAMILSVAPAIVAWLLLLPPSLLGLILLPVLFILLWLADEQMPRIGAPHWYLKLRRLLTAVVVLSLMGAIAGLGK
jgi:hypothetical protein